MSKRPTKAECLQAEIEEIIRVAKTNPGGLIDFLMCNYPREWGLSKEEHRAVLYGFSDE